VSLPIILLAAGASSRMGGRDKLLEPIHGEPLLARMARMACTVSDCVIVALPPPPHPRYGALRESGAHPISVPDAAEGMNASLRAALAALPGDAPAFLLLLADLPDIRAEDITAVLIARENHPEALIWRAATENGKPGHPIIFSAALFPQIAVLQGDDGAKSVVKAARGRIHLIPLPGERARLDLDTPEDWSAWRARHEIPH